MHLWRDVTTRFPANIYRPQFSEDVYAFVLWRYVAVQIWRVKELFVPGIVASTINILSWYLHLTFTVLEIKFECRQFSVNFL